MLRLLLLVFTFSHNTLLCSQHPGVWLASMSSSRKRSRASSGIEPDLLIRTAEGQPIPAKAVLVRTISTFSTCAEELPADAKEWDVGGFLFEGGPFSRQTVKCWLNCGHSMLYGPGELDAQDQAQLSTANGLRSVLAFAHAVGSPEGLCKAACCQLQALVLEVQLPEQSLQLPVSPEGGGAYMMRAVGEHWQLSRFAFAGWIKVGPALSPEQEQDLKQQVAAQMAALLTIAHMLHLQPLIDVLHSFVRMGMCTAKVNLFHGVLDQVFTKAVLEAALGSSTVSKETYMRSVLAQPCSLVGNELCPQGIVKPVGKYKVDPDTGAVVEAELLQEFQGGKAGDVVMVTVDLFADDGLALGIKSTSGEKIWLAACLMLGNSITREGQLAM